MKTKRIASVVAGAAGIVSMGLSGASAATAYNDAVLASHPSYYWTFDEGSGNAIDQVSAGGSADDLVPDGGAARGAGTTTPSGISLGSAVAGGGGRFSATDLSGSGSLTTFAVEFWAKIDSNLSSYLLTFDDNSPAVINNYAGSSLELFSGGGGSRTNSSGPTTLSDNAWHHVVIGNTGTTQTFLIDNLSPVTVDTSPAVANPIAQAKLFVGGSAGGDLLNGSIDELAVYDLSAVRDFPGALSEIAGHYNVAATPEPTAVGFLGIVGIAALRRRRAK